MEDETYHTQGSFFHVVLQLQKKIRMEFTTESDMLFLLECSLIENLCFAFTRANFRAKSDKYRMRVNDASTRIKGIKSMAKYAKFKISEVVAVVGTLLPYQNRNNVKSEQDYLSDIIKKVFKLLFNCSKDLCGACELKEMRSIVSSTSTWLDGAT